MVANVPYHTVANGLCQHVQSTHVHVSYHVYMYCKYVLVRYTHPLHTFRLQRAITWVYTKSLYWKP